MALKVVAAIIENTHGDILIAQRPVGKSCAGQWEFPGGKIEPGETEEAALCRELNEELHLAVSLVKRLGNYLHRYAWGEIDLIVFVVKALNEPRATADVNKFKWIDADKISAEDFVEADLQPLTIYLSGT